jgi:hypothetical protein
MQLSVTVFFRAVFRPSTLVYVLGLLVFFLDSIEVTADYVYYIQVKLVASPQTPLRYLDGPVRKPLSRLRTSLCEVLAS